MGMGTLIIYVFPLGHTFPQKSVFDLVDLYLCGSLPIFFLLLSHAMLHNFLFQLKFKSNMINCVKNLLTFAV